MIVEILSRFSSFVAGLTLLFLSFTVAAAEYERFFTGSLGFGGIQFGVFIAVLFFLLALPLILWPITPNKWWRL